jgi:hypothetical protein
MLTHLQGLGIEKFRTIVGLLKQGTPQNLIVHWIQDELGDCCDVQEDILSEELESLHKDLTTGSKKPEQPASQGIIGMQRLGSPGHGCLDQLVGLAEIQARRIQHFLKKEESSNCIIPEIDTMIAGHARHVRDIQEIKFYLGIDTYLRRVPEDVRARLENLERQEQETERQVYEAYAAAEQVFKKLSARREHEVDDVNSCSDARGMQPKFI